MVLLLHLMQSLSANSERLCPIILDSYDKCWNKRCADGSYILRCIFFLVLSSIVGMYCADIPHYAHKLMIEMNTSIINKRYYPFTFPLKIKQFFKFLVQCNAKDQCQLCSGTKLPRFNRTDCISWYTNQFRQLCLRQLFLYSRFLEVIFQFQLVIHFLTTISCRIKKTRNMRHSAK